MKYSVLALLVSAALLPLSASAHHYTFNSALIDGGKGDVDVSLFNEGLQLPGTYNVTVTVNGNTVDSDVAVPFRLSGEGKQRTLHPCLTAEQLTRYGVDISGYPVLSADAQCADPDVIPQATVHFDFNRQLLSL
ncbi:TPA: capsule biosynthesis protein, partial [Salmonella enterica]|nr:capsule biosynthesis protein [Salmonella enterica]